MGLRDRLSKKFGSKKNGSDSSSQNGSSSPRRKDIEYYKPHEIPKSKYRGKVDKAHQDRLEAYSLGDAFNAAGRRASQALSGTFSPGGTKAQSRRGSWMSRAKSSLSTTSVDSEDGRDSSNMRRKSVASAKAPKEDTVDENDEDDTMVSNTALSRTPTALDEPFKTQDQVDMSPIALERTTTAKPSISTSPTATLFTMQELEQAMSRATMRPRRGTVIAAALPTETVAA